MGLPSLSLPSLVLGRSAVNAHTSAAGVPVPPPGFVFLTEVENGVTYYLTDNDGYYLVELI
jgi:hypothetical protein